MNKLKIAYLGTPDFAATLLESLAKSDQLEIKFVVTQPDKPVGRKLIVTESPVKITAKKLKITVYDDLNRDFSHVDLALVYAYGKIIPANFLHQPRYGFLNFHPSLLPKLRGPSPTAFSLINGDKKTGITIIQLDEKMDHGPIVVQEEILIKPDEKRSELENRLTERGEALFMAIVNQILTASTPSPLPSQPQHDGGATYTRLLTKKDGFVSFEELKSPSPEKIYNLFRGLYPWPGIWTTLPDGRRLKITDMSLENGQLILKKVQLEGKNEVDFPTFQRAYNLF